MAEEFVEYSTFTVKNKDGEEIELAVIEEFRYEGKDYVAAALIEEDNTINADGVYLYKASIGENGEIKAEKIRDFDYDRVVQAYLELD